MTERIYSDEDLSAIRLQCYEAGRLGKGAYTVRGGGEAVVRCRDCKHAECYESGLVGPFILCSHFESEGCKAMVEPSGFCACGGTREVE